MLASFTGKYFRDCLKSYMHTFQYKNASTNDLLAICDKISGKTHGMLPSEYFKPWLT